MRNGGSAGAARRPRGFRHAAARRRRLLRHAAAWAPSLAAPIATPHLDAFARESVRFDRAYPEALPTLCARRTIYTGRRTYPFHNGDFRHIKGDFVGIAPGWGPIPESQATLAEMYEADGFRTGLVSDLYHEFKPSKNFWRGFHQWTFIRGQEADAARSGPFPSQAEIDYWVPRELQELRGKATGLEQPGYGAALVLEPHPAQHARSRARGAVVQRAGHAGSGALGRAEPRCQAPVPHRRIVRSARAVVRARALPAALRRWRRPRAGHLAVRGDAVAAAGPGDAHARQLRGPRRDVRPLVRAPDRDVARDRRARRGAGHRHVRPRPQPVGAARLHRQARLSVRSRKLRGAAARSPSAKDRRGHHVQRVRPASRHRRDDARRRRRHAAGSRSTASRSGTSRSPMARRSAIM